ncbi:flavodoxin family protein [Halomonas sp. TBZ9]|uniref:Flavodoxin family protein n=1 Tax=Vreelandella azerica TaxID=2732867 RepID=A0A7Y3TZ06_9GAMM|nr:flavodoxin family protein [Halomonas azerica]NOG32077.1 flavodoxin family protein [Halomonas azerica]
MKTLLAVVHAPSANTQRLSGALETGAHHPDIEGINCVCKSPHETVPEDILNADGIIIGTTENLGYMAGMTKDLFDRCYYAVLEQKQGLPCALYVRAGHDGTGTQRGIESIITGLRWRWVQPPLILRGQWDNAFCDQVEELGTYMAAGLENGLF